MKGAYRFYRPTRSGSRSVKNGMAWALTPEPERAVSRHLFWLFGRVNLCCNLSSFLLLRPGAAGSRRFMEVEEGEVEEGEVEGGEAAVPMEEGACEQEEHAAAQAHEGSAVTGKGELKGSQEAKVSFNCHASRSTCMTGTEAIAVGDNEPAAAESTAAWSGPPAMDFSSPPTRTRHATLPFKVGSSRDSGSSLYMNIPRTSLLMVAMARSYMRRTQRISRKASSSRLTARAS